MENIQNIDASYRAYCEQQKKLRALRYCNGKAELISSQNHIAEVYYRCI